VAGQGASTLFTQVLSLSWKWSFLVETGMMMGPVIIMYLCIPSRYYMMNAEGESEVPVQDMAHSVDVRPMILSNFSYKGGAKSP
jgi:hypothetical protein